MMGISFELGVEAEMYVFSRPLCVSCKHQGQNIALNGRASYHTSQTTAPKRATLSMVFIWDLAVIFNATNIEPFVMHKPRLPAT